MKRTALFMVALLVFALVPAVASAQTDEQAAAIAALEEALDGLECATPEGCTEEVAELQAAVAALKAVFPDLDYAALDAAIGELEGEIEVEGEIEPGAEAVAAAGAAVVAEADAAAGEGGEGGEGGDGTPAPTAVNTGSATPNSPNTALLGAASILMLLSVGAFAIRQKVARR